MVRSADMLLRLFRLPIVAETYLPLLSYLLCFVISKNEEKSTLPIRLLVWNIFVKRMPDIHVRLTLKRIWMHMGMTASGHKKMEAKCFP